MKVKLHETSGREVHLMNEKGERIFFSEDHYIDSTQIGLILRSLGIEVETERDINIKQTFEDYDWTIRIGVEEGKVVMGVHDFKTQTFIPFEELVFEVKQWTDTDDDTLRQLIDQFESCTDLLRSELEKRQ